MLYGVHLGSRVTLVRSLASLLRTYASRPGVTKVIKKYSELPSTFKPPTDSLKSPEDINLEQASSTSPKFDISRALEETIHTPRRRQRKRSKNLTAQSDIQHAEPDNKKHLSQGTSGHDPSSPKNSLAQEILDNLRRFPHCLLLTRVGQFYESYFDQANEISRLLNIKLTSRKWDGRRVPMCGFPLMHLDKYLKILVQQNRRFVALCEEFPRHATSGVKEFERRVVRVVTPGTLIDESFLNPYENNYLLAVGCPTDGTSHSRDTPIGLAWIDVSTGEFFSKSSTCGSLRDELARISPREIVLDERLEAEKSSPVFEALAEEDNFLTYISPSDSNSSADMPVSSGPSLMEAENISNISPLDPTETSHTLPSAELSSVHLLTTHLEASLLEQMPRLALPDREAVNSRMEIDSYTIKALEVREAFREGGVKGSLMSIVKRTVTTGGSRMLARLLCSPSTSIAEINSRQALVAIFHARPHFRMDLAQLLADSDDAGRIVQKFILGRGDASDLLAFSKTIHAWSDISMRIMQETKFGTAEQDGLERDEWQSLEVLQHRLTDLSALSGRIISALGPSPESPRDELPTEEPFDEDEGPGSTSLSDVGPLQYSSGKWTINPAFSQTIARLHGGLEELVQQKIGLENELRIQYDAPSLTLRASPALGMHVHLARSKRDQGKLNANPQFISIAESGSTRSYFFAAWSKLGAQIMETTIALAAAEKEALEALRQEVNEYAMVIRQNARVMDELDVAIGFAKLAEEMNFVRPTITDEPIFLVEDGRHPTVELGLLTSGRVFTPNSLNLTAKSNLHIITGPNMAGKSTFLRQNALIAILAQTGSFVPADQAVVGIVDKLFSRIGAKDDLFHDRSTFMVEMLETAEILRRATARSLVIMDEVGRGTTVRDGLAIAFATIHHLLTVNRCRSLFATHFHELSDMLSQLAQRSDQGLVNNVRFFCTDIDEIDEDRFVYSYRLRPGVNRDSHGLKVAQLAGMPPAAMAVAKMTLSQLYVQSPIIRNAIDNLLASKTP